MSIPPGMASPSRQPLRAERDFREGYGAWLRGDLGRAVTLLEAAALEAPGSPDPRLFLSRALAERKDTARALAVIDEAMALDPHGESGPLFRAIILLDAGDPGASAALAASRRSYLGAALLALLDTAGENGPLELPAPARWIPDASGRLLARLEARLLAGGAEGWIDTHHAAFSGGPEGTSLKKAEPKKPFASAKTWWKALDPAFARKDYARVLELHEDGESEPLRDLASSVLYIFSLIARGEDERARRVALELRREHPASEDLHFLEGLALVRSGRSAEAAWCFTRAARFADVDMDDIAVSVSGKLGLAIRWTA